MIGIYPVCARLPRQNNGRQISVCVMCVPLVRVPTAYGTVSPGRQMLRPKDRETPPPLDYRYYFILFCARGLVVAVAYLLQAHVTSASRRPLLLVLFFFHQIRPQNAGRVLFPAGAKTTDSCFFTYVCIYVRHKCHVYAISDFVSQTYYTYSCIENEVRATDVFNVWF